MEENIMETTEVLSGDVIDNAEVDVIDDIDAGTTLLHDDLSLLAKLIGFLACLGGIGSLVAGGFGIKKLVDFLKGKFGGKKSKKAKKSGKKSKKAKDDDTSEDDEVEEDSEE